MSVATLDTRPATTTTHDLHAPSAMNNRGVYTAWGLAWLLGHGSYAISSGSDPLLALPATVPIATLAVSMLAAFTVTMVTTARAARGVTGPAALPGKLLGTAWAKPRGSPEVDDLR